ncbi:Plasmodium exported protein (hyp6), unknown, putative [Plasmodium sp.]|nr:Plasmodium exported protein (hyp6), unknown, putative [Plasmodium sp.]
MYNNKSQLKVSQINNNNDDYVENKISSSQTQFLKSSKKNSNNSKSENNNNYIITKKEETLEDLLKEYHEDMIEINNKKEKTFFKRAKLVLEVFDNIFIDKVIDSKIQNKQSELKEDIIDNSVILCASAILAIPIISYFSKRMDFFKLPN